MHLEMQNTLQDLPTAVMRTLLRKAMVPSVIGVCRLRFLMNKLIGVRSMGQSRVDIFFKVQTTAAQELQHYYILHEKIRPKIFC